MHTLHTHDPSALKCLLTEDLYLISKNKDLIEEKNGESMESDLSAISKTPTTEKNDLYFDYLGENNTYFLILIEDKKHPQIAPTTLETLLKIMHAKGLALKDLAILNSANYPNVCFDDLKAFFACAKIVLLGINPQQLGLPPTLAANQPEVCHGVKIMASYSLAEMDANQDRKREFWNVMKKF